MTVSRTINDHPYVSEETAKKVRAAVRELNYRPNHAARVLTGQISRSIGLIVPDISDSFFSIISQAVQETARANGYLLWLAASGENPAIEASHVEMMTTFGADGILLVPSDSRKTYLKTLVAGATPVITIDRPIEIARTDSVEVENRAGARLAVDHLIQHGYKRIACIAINPHLLTIKQRIAGYRDSLRHAKLPAMKELHLPKQASTKPALSKLFASRNPPDALFTANNITTIWVIEALKELKIKLGKDLALVGFDDIDFFAQLTPAVTAVRQPVSEMGKLAAQILLKNIQGERTPAIVRNVLPVTLVIRESCGCKATDSRQ
jgi:LacI family transcriptional regulator